jgi:hypothetical protein
VGDSYQWPPQTERPRQQPRHDRSKTWLGLLLGSPVLAALIAGLFAWSPWNGGTPAPNTPSTSPGVSFTLPGNPSIFVNPTSGAGGTVVRVSGDGFPANAHVVIYFHTEEIGDTTANGDGKFSNVTVTIPTSFSEFAPQQFFIHADSGAFDAQTPFMLTG